MFKTRFKDSSKLLSKRQLQRNIKLEAYKILSVFHDSNVSNRLSYEHETKCRE